MADPPSQEHGRVALAEIAPHPANFRKTLTDLDELAASIAQQGLVEPLEVMPADRVAAAWPEHVEALDGHKWVLLRGHRRLAAARQALAEDPNAHVRVLIRRDEICDAPALQLDMMVTEEVARRSWNPIEQARAFQAAREAGRSQRQIAERYACAQSHVSQRLALLRLPEGIQQAVETGRLGVHDALRLAKLDDQNSMRAAWGLYLDQREDAWITNVDQAIAEYADRAAYQARREAALTQAAAEGIQVVDPVEEFGRQLPAHRLTDPEQVAAARAAGTLAAGISGHGDLAYYTTAPAPEPGARLAGPDPDQRRAAAAARERAGRLLAAQRPAGWPETLRPVIDAFLRTAPEGWRPIARRWLRWLRLGPDTGTHAWSPTRRARPQAGADAGRGAGLDPGRWWEQVYAADWETRVWAAHCLTLAAYEHRARTQPDWDQADRAWLWRLVTEAGYLPRPWERHRLGEDSESDPAAETRPPPAADAPPGWFEPHQQCPAITWLNGAELAWLERDPKRFHEAEQLQQCRLETGHPGRHAAHVQDAGAEYYDFEQRTGVLALWAWWRDRPTGHNGPEERRLGPAEPCPTTGPSEESCLLFAGHPRRHA